MPTPNMGLTLPTDHGSADVWDTILDTVFNTIDSHDHTTGKGVKVPSAGLNINADVSWSSGGTYYALKDAKAIDMQPTTAASVAGYSSVLYTDSSDGELHWIDGSARNAKLTLNGAINVALVGGIGGDYSSVGALFSFDDATDRYLAQQQGGPRPWAGIALGNLDIYQQAASISNRVRQKSPNALAASYDMTWFAALPGSQAITQIDNGGTWTASNTVASISTNGAATFNGTTIISGATTLSGAITIGGTTTALSGVISPASLGSSQNDWAPAGIATANVVRVTLSAFISITGINATQGAGRLLWLSNLSNQNLTITHEDVLSTAANRFNLANSANIVLTQYQGVMFWYDGSAARWKTFGAG